MLFAWLCELFDVLGLRRLVARIMMACSQDHPRHYQRANPHLPGSGTEMHPPRLLRPRLLNLRPLLPRHLPPSPAAPLLRTARGPRPLYQNRAGTGQGPVMITYIHDILFSYTLYVLRITSHSLTHTYTCDTQEHKCDTRGYTHKQNTFYNKHILERTNSVEAHRRDTRGYTGTRARKMPILCPHTHTHTTHTQHTPHAHMHSLTPLSLLSPPARPRSLSPLSRSSSIHVTTSTSSYIEQSHAHTLTKTKSRKKTPYQRPRHHTATSPSQTVVVLHTHNLFKKTHILKKKS